MVVRCRSFSHQIIDIVVGVQLGATMVLAARREIVHGCPTAVARGAFIGRQVEVVSKEAEITSKTSTRIAYVQQR